MSNYAPWYQIAWRTLWWIPLQALRVAMVSVAFIGWGKRAAARFWKDT
jgi:hypothetical protein